MSAESESQSEAQQPGKPVVAHRKEVAKPLNLSKRAAEAKKAERDLSHGKEAEKKLPPPPQPIPNHRAVPQDEVLNKKD